MIWLVRRIYIQKRVGSTTVYNWASFIASRNQKLDSKNVGILVVTGILGQDHA